ncbi:MAG: response regulator [Bdellovibrionales bacterium]|nr:response regulator [Bdellovibrionales bacterium]
MSETDEGLTLSPKERATASVLVVETDRNERQNMRTALKQLGFGNMTDVPNHMAALERIQERPITHIIFDAKKTNMPPKDFVSQVMDLDPNVILIPSSFDPNIDDVFDLLVLGARGYLVKPFTTESVDMAIIGATKGEPIAESVKQAKDRNEALVAILMASLDKAATILRQAKQFDTAKREVPRAMRSFRGSAELAKTFAKDGPEGLIEAMERFCIERSKGPATRLGRLRKRLKTKSKKDSPKEESASA